MDLRRILFISTDRVSASVLERELGSEFEVHSAATDDAAFALLDSYAYRCVVVDLCARSAAGPDASSTIRLNALTTPVIAIMPAGAETVLPQNAIACVNDESGMSHLVQSVRETCR